MVKLDRDNREQMPERSLRTCLAGVPSLKIAAVRQEAPQPEGAPDLVAEVELPSGTETLVLESKSSGQPKVARDAIPVLRRYREKYPNSYGVLAAPYISPETAEICAEAGVGYLDFSGNCRLSFGGIYIEREGKPNQFAEKRDLRSLYSNKASRVLRVLLSEPRKTWTVSNLASTSEVSLGLAWKVKKLLLDREWVAVNNAGVLLTRPEELLSEWAESYSFRKSEIQDYYSLKSAAETEASLAAFCSSRGIRYALTAFSGAARLAPAVRYQRAFAYVDGPIGEVAGELGLKRVSSGANVTLLKPYDEGVFYGAQERDGISIASAVQIYLDLASFKGRGEEAAEAILREVIKPQW